MAFYIDEFLAPKTWRPHTKQTCQRHLGYWQDWLENKNLVEISIADFEHWVADKGWGDSMHYNSLWAIKSYIRWLDIEHPLLKHSVPRKIPLYKFHKLSEVQAMANTCDLSTPKGLQDATIVWFLWETWARANEVINATVEFLDLEEQEISFVAKAGDSHTSAFGPDLRELLEHWLPVRATIARPETETIFINIRRGTPLVYTGIYSIFTTLGEKVALKAQMHSVRRGAAKKHAEDGGNDRQGLEQGGWKSWEMYWRYTRGVRLDSFKKKRWRDNEH